MSVYWFVCADLCAVAQGDDGIVLHRLAEELGCMIEPSTKFLSQLIVGDEISAALEKAQEPTDLVGRNREQLLW